MSLFKTVKESTTYPSFVLAQELPASKAHLPSFNGFKSFFPPVRKPRVAAYVHRSFLSSYSLLLKFKGVDDLLALDVFSQQPLLRTSFHSFRLINAYSTNTRDHPVHSVSPETLFPALGVPLLVVGDLNINNAFSDPQPSFSPHQIISSPPNFEKAVVAGFALLNRPGKYTRFPLVGKARLLITDLSFSNPLLLPLVKSWEVSLPSTSSDHVPITINLAPPNLIASPKWLWWSDMDWETISPIIKTFQISAPQCPSQADLDAWLAGSLDRLTAL